MEKLTIKEVNDFNPNLYKPLRAKSTYFKGNLSKVKIVSLKDEQVCLIKLNGDLTILNSTVLRFFHPININDNKRKGTLLGENDYKVEVEVHPEKIIIPPSIFELKQCDGHTYCGELGTLYLGENKDGVYYGEWTDKNNRVMFFKIILGG